MFKLLAVVTYVVILSIGIAIEGIDAPFMFTFLVSSFSSFISGMIWSLESITEPETYETKKPKYKIGQTVIIIHGGSNDTDRRKLYPCPILGVYDVYAWEHQLYKIHDIHNLTGCFKYSNTKYSYTLTLNGKVVGTVYENGLYPCSQKAYDEYWASYEPEQMLECDTVDGAYL
jgi:hypothetical protein